MLPCPVVDGINFTEPFFASLHILYNKYMEIWEEIRADTEKGAKRLVAEFRDRLFGASFVLQLTRIAFGLILVIP